MSTAEAEFKAAGFVERRRYRRRTVNRTALGLVVAAAEGSAAFATVLGSAFIYHILVLDLPVGGVDWPLYFIFAALAGILCGAFSTTAVSRYLDSGERPRSTLPESFYGWTAALSLTLLLAFLLGSIGDLSRVSLTAAYLAGIPVMLALRSFGQALLAKRIARGELHYQRVAVLGKRLDVMNFLLNGDLWRQGHQVTHTLYLEDLLGADGDPGRAAIAEFARTSLKKRTDSIVIVSSFDDLNAIEGLVDEMKRFALNIVYAPATANRTLKFLDVVPIGANNAVRFIRKPLSDVSVFSKRAMDLALATVGLIVLTPVFAVVALAIKLDSPGPVIYRQARRGFNGETFMIWKFRSMRVTESGHAMQQAQRGDSRITTIGRFIRATSIDELPQLVNVLFGQMSIVGPRPHAIVHDDELGKVLATYAHRQRIKPGITGWAQVNGFRGETSTFEAVQGRTLHDLHYIDNWSIVMDVWIIILTVFSVRTHRNVF
ncbi:MAG: exopolysaccharide biosynthesis polyprenyl glycosylphosphotransferase [Hyphomicrobiales bacterium]|nr:MAG: exopolysaccharide biosynthesis polyprenyl glycosylphosphotransferase [Hyphomicrobiales bacterium]